MKDQITYKDGLYNLAKLHVQNDSFTTFVKT